ncbi:MAG: glycosyltransferase family 1 protein [Thermoflexales bacterium]
MTDPTRAGAPLCAFDLTPLQLAESSGVGRYTRELLRGLEAAPGGWRFGGLANRPLALSGLRLTTPLLPAAPGPRRLIWIQTGARVALRRARPAVAHFTNMVAPVWAPCPVVLTVHDASLVLHPKLHAFRHWLAVRPMLPLMARRASAVITVSESAKADIVACLGVRPDRVRVIYNGPSDQCRPVTEPDVIRSVRQRHGLPERFFLFVGTLEPRKNALGLINALAIARAVDPEMAVAMVGPLGWKYEATLVRIERLGLGRAVHRLGYVADGDLPALYSACQAVVYPSLYEGFGFPIVEGMACGAPVITSNVSSMREIAGQAGYLCDPRSPEAIARAMLDIAGNPELAAGLRAKGLVRAAQFSWRRAAAETLTVYESVAAPR